MVDRHSELTQEPPKPVVGRRCLLASGATLATVALAGCLDDGDGDSAAEPANGNDSGNNTNMTREEDDSVNATDTTCEEGDTGNNPTELSEVRIGGGVIGDAELYNNDTATIQQGEDHNISYTTSLRDGPEREVTVHITLGNVTTCQTVTPAVNNPDTLTAYYTLKQVSGLTAELEPGTYDLRLFADNTTESYEDAVEVVP